MRFNKFIYLGFIAGYLTLIFCLEQAASFNGDINLWAYDSPTDNADKRPIGNYGGGYYGRQTNDVRKGEIVKNSNRTYGSKAENYPYSLEKSMILTSKSLEPLTFENKLRLYEEPFRQYLLQTTGKIPSDSDMKRLWKDFLEFVRISEGIKQKEKKTIRTQLDLDKSIKKQKNKRRYKKIPKYLIFEGMDDYDFKPEEVIKYMPKISKSATKEEVEKVYQKVWKMLGKSKARLNVLYEYYLDKYNEKNPLGPVETEEERLAYNRHILDLLTNDVLDNNDILDSAFIPRQFIEDVYNSLEGNDNTEEEAAEIISQIHVLLNKEDIEYPNIPDSERFDVPISSKIKEVITNIRSVHNRKSSKEDNKEINIPKTEQNKKKPKLPQLPRKFNTRKFKSEAQIKFEDSKWVSQSLKRVANNQGDYIIVEKKYCTAEQWKKLLKLASIGEVDHTSKLAKEYLNQYKNDHNTVPSMYGSAMGKNLAKQPKFVFIYKNFKVLDLDDIDISNLEVIEGHGLELISKKRGNLEAVIKHPETGFKMHVNYSKPGLPLVNLYLDDKIQHTFKFNKDEYLNSISLDVRNTKEILTESLKLNEDISEYYSSFIQDDQEKQKFIDNSRLIKEKLSEVLDTITESEHWAERISRIIEKKRTLVSEYSKLNLFLLEENLKKDLPADKKLHKTMNKIDMLINKIVLLDSQYRDDLDEGGLLIEDSKFYLSSAFEKVKEVKEIISEQYLIYTKNPDNTVIDIDDYTNQLSRIISSVLLNKLYIEDMSSTYEGIHDKYLRNMIKQSNLNDRTREIFQKALKLSKGNSKSLNDLKLDANHSS
ncbi:hypothetical protein ACR3K2_18110 [Cryptosporidium serpentis]